MISPTAMSVRLPGHAGLARRRPGAAGSSRRPRRHAVDVRRGVARRQAPRRALPDRLSRLDRGNHRPSNRRATWTSPFDLGPPIMQPPRVLRLSAARRRLATPFRLTSYHAGTPGTTMRHGRHVDTEASKQGGVPDGVDDSLLVFAVANWSSGRVRHSGPRRRAPPSARCRSCACAPPATERRHVVLPRSRRRLARTVRPRGRRAWPE